MATPTSRSYFDIVSDKYDRARWCYDVMRTSTEAVDLVSADAYVSKGFQKIMVVVLLLKCGNTPFVETARASLDVIQSGNKIIKVDWNRGLIERRPDAFNMKNICDLALLSIRLWLLLLKSMTPKKNRRVWMILCDLMIIGNQERNLPALLTHVFHGGIKHAEKDKKKDKKEQSATSIRFDIRPLTLAEREKCYERLRNTHPNWTDLIESKTIPIALLKDEILLETTCGIDPKHPPVRDPVCLEVRGKLFDCERATWVTWKELKRQIPGLQCLPEEALVDDALSELKKNNIDQRLAQIAREAGLIGAPRLVKRGRLATAFWGVCSQITPLRDLSKDLIVLSTSVSVLIHSLPSMVMDFVQLMACDKHRRRHEDTSLLLPGPNGADPVAPMTDANALTEGDLRLM